MRHTALILLWTCLTGCIEIPPFPGSDDAGAGAESAANGDTEGGDVGAIDPVDEGGEGSSPEDTEGAPDDASGEAPDSGSPDSDGPDSDAAEPDPDVLDAGEGDPGDVGPDVPVGPDAPDSGEEGTPDADLDGETPPEDTLDATDDAGLDTEGEPDEEIIVPEPDPLAKLNDEFNGGGVPANWGFGHVDAGDANPWTNFGQFGGVLMMEPTNTGWFENFKGPFLYKEISGNFAVVTSVSTSRKSDIDLAPANPFHVGGIMARDPVSAAIWEENWVLVDVGKQLNALGTAVKSTEFLGSGKGAVTTKLEQLGSHEGLLVLCRVGTKFYFYRRLTDDADWVPLHSVNRPDLPATLQVGPMAGAWPPVAPPAADLRVEFDYVRFATPETNADCLSSLNL